MKPKNHPELTAERLREVLSYDSETGVFCWLKPLRNGTTGALAGGFRADGYLVIGMHGKTYRAHRLAWLFVHGCWPVADIDHINGDRADNRMGNLRAASRAENQQNRTLDVKNTSGFHGVSRYAGGKKWRARIQVDGVEQHLGTFESPEDAEEAYLAAKAALHTFQPTPR